MPDVFDPIQVMDSDEPFSTMRACKYQSFCVGNSYRNDKDTIDCVFVCFTKTISIRTRRNPFISIFSVCLEYSLALLDSRKTWRHSFQFSSYFTFFMGKTSLRKHTEARARSSSKLNHLPPPPATMWWRAPLRLALIVYELGRLIACLLQGVALVRELTSLQI